MYCCACMQIEVRGYGTEDNVLEAFGSKRDKNDIKPGGYEDGGEQRPGGKAAAAFPLLQ